jgi:hypothetical protein
MVRRNRTAWRRSAIGIALACISAAAWAAEKQPPKPQPEAVELFSAIEKKQIEVQLIPKDSTECRLLITNKTGKPLSVMLPDVFAGVPALAQQGLRPRNDKSPQRIGIANNLFNPMMNPNQFQNPLLNVPNNGNNPGWGPRPFRAFNVAPEKVGRLKLPAVCLDPGNPNPRAAIPYELKPLAGASDKPGVAEVCAMLGRGEVKQVVAQLAAWHLNNDASWEKLAKMQRKYALVGKPLYSADEIAAAKKLAEKALKLAQDTSASRKQ